MVKCAECGLLALRRGDGALIEADDSFRATAGHGALPDGPPVGPWVRRAGMDPPSPRRDEWIFRRPLCFARAANFRQEVLDQIYARGVPVEDAIHQVEFPKEEDVLAVIHAPRLCDYCTDWQQGFTPKEHREMLDRKWAQERDDKLRREMNEREDTRDARVEQRENDRDAVAKNRHRNEILVFGVVIAVATIIGAVLEGSISRGWNPF